MKAMIAAAAGAAGVLYALWLTAAPVQAQPRDEAAPATPAQTEPQAPTAGNNLRSWVSGTGDDANPCSRTAPCKSFQGAMNKTAVGGEINCLDPAGYGTVSIAWSVTIDCHDQFASIALGPNVGSQGIAINFDSFGASDSQKTVRLRNINVNGFGAGNYGLRITGGATVAGGTVIVEDCVIDGIVGSPGHGIADTRSNGGALFVSHSTIRQVAGNGFEVAPATGNVAITVLLNDVRVQKANFGLTIASGVTAMVKNSVFSANNNGLEADGGAQMNIENSAINANTTGIWALGTVRISNSDVAFNGTAVSGTLTSFTNSRFSDNGTVGTINPIGNASTPTGQQ